MAAVAPDQNTQQHGVGIDIVFRARIGEAPSLHAIYQGTELAAVSATQAAQAADSRPLAQESVAKAVGTLPDSGFRVLEVRLDCPQSLFVPASQIKSLRRELLAALPPPPQPRVLPFAPPLLSSPNAGQRPCGWWCPASLQLRQPLPPERLASAWMIPPWTFGRQSLRV